MPILESVNDEAAKDIGYPLMIGAAAGGGGKGMRIVDDESQLDESIKLAKQEAMNAFGDDRIFIVRYIERSRHIEVQILQTNMAMFSILVKENARFKGGIRRSLKKVLRLELTLNKETN